MSNLLQHEQHPDADTLSAFAEGSLPPHEREAALSHMTLCARCRELVRLALPPLGKPLPLPVVPERRTSAGWRWRRSWVWTGAAACAGLGLATVFLLHPGNRSSGLHDERNVARMVAPPPPSPGPQENPPLAGQGRAAPPSSTVSSPKPSPKRLQPSRAAAPPSPIPASDRTVTPASQHESAMLPRPASDVDAIVHKQQMQGLPLERRSYVLRSENGPIAGTVAQASGATKPALEARALNQQGKPIAAAPAPLTMQANSTVTVEAANGELGTAANKAEATQLLPELPSHLPTESHYAEGRRVVAADTAGAIFWSKDDGQHWKSVKSQWGGRVLRVGSPGELPPPAVPAQAAAGRFRAGTAALEGTVLDQSGAGIAGCSITVSGGGSTLRVTADRDGHYAVDSLAAGQYSLHAEAPGFQPLDTSLEHMAGEHTEKDLVLQVSAISQTVEVAADSAVTSAKARRIPIFALVTSTGERWVSVDGKKWARQ